MSEPIDFKTSVSASATTHTAELPRPAVENELITVAYSFGAIPGTFTPPTGYTEIALSDNTDGTAAALYLCYKVAGVGGESSIPAATFSIAQPCTMGVVIWEDANTSSPIGNVGDSQGVKVYSDTPALTTTVNNSAIWHVCGFDQNGVGRLLSGGKLLAINTEQATEGISMSYGFKKTAGATTPGKYKCDDNNIFASIEIKDSGSGSSLPHMDTATPMKLINGSNTVSRSATSVLTSLNGKTCDDDADGTIRATVPVGSAGWYELSESANRTELFSTLTTGRYGIVDYTFNDADLTNNPHVLLAIGPNINEKFTGTVANGGVVFGVYSQRGDAGQAYRAWTVSGRDDERFREARERDVSVIDITDTASMLASSGTFDITKVDGYFIAILNDLAHTPDIEWLYRDQIYAVVPIQFIGGDADEPITVGEVFSWIEKCYAGQGYLQGSSQGIARFPLVLGNNSTVCTVDFSGSSIEFEPSRYEGTFKHFIFDDNFLGITFKATSACVPNYSNMVIKGETPYHWKIDSSASADADWNFNGHQAIGPGLTEINVADISGVTFSGRSELTKGGGTLSDSIIDNTSGTQAITITGANQAAVQAQLDDYCASNTFTNNAIAITVDFAGDLTLTPAEGITFSGNTVDINYTGTGTLTWVNANGTNATLTATPGGGTVAIVNPSTGIELTGLVAGSQVVVFETGTTTEKYRDDTSGTSSDWDTTGSQGTVDYTIMKAGYLPIRITGLVVGSSKLSIGVEQTFDPIYSSSSGLTHSTDTSYNTTTKKLTLTKATTIRNLYSAWIEFWIAQSAYANKPFPLQAYGFNTVAFIDGAEFVNDSHGETYITRGGWRYVDTGGTITAQWLAALSIGEATGFTGEYQQVAGGTVTNARASGVFDQVIKIYGDASHGNFDYTDHLVLKFQPDGYRPAEVDVVSQYNGEDLFDTLYVVGLEPEEIDGLATGDPGITDIAITNHGASPVSWNSKSWSITITDSATNSGEEILQWLRYNCSLDATFQGQDPFNWPEMVVQDGDKFKTERGTLWGSAGATLKGVRVLRGTDPHPDFSTMQADDGTLYTVPTVAGVLASGLTGDGYAVLYNVTQDAVMDSTTTSGAYSYSWTDGTDADAGDTIRLRWRSQGKEAIEATFVATADSIVELLDAPVEDAVYTAYYDTWDTHGSEIDMTGEFTLDGLNVQIDLEDGDNTFYGARMYLWYSYAMASETGILYFWDEVEATDASNILIGDTLLDNLKTVDVKQGDRIVIAKRDGSYPAVSPTTGGGGVSMYWNGIGFTANGGSGLDGTQNAKLMSLQPPNATVDGSITVAQLQKILLAMAAGLVEGAEPESDEIAFKAQDGTSDVITAQKDQYGNRTSVNLTP